MIRTLPPATPDRSLPMGIFGPTPPRGHGLAQYPCVGPAHLRSETQRLAWLKQADARLFLNKSLAGDERTDLQSRIDS